LSILRAAPWPSSGLEIVLSLATSLPPSVFVNGLVASVQPLPTSAGVTGFVLLSSGADVPLLVALQAALETMPQNEQALVWSFDDAGDLELVADTTMDKAHIISQLKALRGRSTAGA
jgi:hypothetical protein